MDIARLTLKEKFYLLFLTVTLTILSTLFSAYALSTVWGWFMVVIFDIQGLTILDAAGLIVVKLAFIPDHAPKQRMEESTFDYFGTMVLRELSGPVIVLVVGYIIKIFM